MFPENNWTKEGELHRTLLLSPLWGTKSKVLYILFHFKTNFADSMSES